MFPYIVVSPAYFAGRIQLGGLMQTASAFSSVQEALSIFITVYRDLAEWRAVIERLAGFDAAIAAARAAAATPPVVSVVKRKDGDAVDIDTLMVKLPNGAPLVEAHDVVIAAGDRVLVTGPSGSGKSTLFRAIAGIWPFGAGTITVPENARVMILPQRPYLPIGSLEAAVTYPAPPGTFDRGRMAEVLAAVGLPALAGRLDEEAHWNRMLSLGEQQRLGIARAILLAPDYLFLDEATASLDEPAEAALYHLLQERLPQRPSFRSATARPCRSSTGGGSSSCARMDGAGSGRQPSPRPRSDARHHQRAGHMSCCTTLCQAKRMPRAGRLPGDRQKETGGGSLRAAARRPEGQMDLLEVPEVQVDLEGGDDGGAAPVGAEATRVDRGDVAAGERSGLCAREYVAVRLREVGVVVAEVEGEHLVGEADADIPVGIFGQGGVKA